MGRTEDAFFRLARADGHDIERGTTLPWLTNRGHLSNMLTVSTTQALRAIHRELGGDEERLEGKRSASLRPDFLLPSQSLLVEVDETQHFTTDRLSTFGHYYEAVKLAFDPVAYMELVKQWKDEGDSFYRNKPAPDFPFPGGRRAQRAYFDVCRDLGANDHGLRVLRIPAPERDPTLAYSRFLEFIDSIGT